MAEVLDRGAVAEDDEVAPLARAVALRPLDVVVREQTGVALEALQHFVLDHRDRRVIHVERLPKEANADRRCRRTQCRPVGHHEPVPAACRIGPATIRSADGGVLNEARMETREEVEVAIRQRRLGEGTGGIARPRSEYGGGNRHAAQGIAVVAGCTETRAGG